MKHFKMLFSNSNSGYLPPSNLGVTKTIYQQPIIKHVALNTPMIERVYKAKPGCSACGKKIS